LVEQLLGRFLALVVPGEELELPGLEPLAQPLRYAFADTIPAGLQGRIAGELLLAGLLNAGEFVLLG